MTDPRECEIELECVAPPIPVRQFDWRAWRKGHEEGLVGWGESSAEAICDLLEREERA